MAGCMSAVFVVFELHLEALACEVDTAFDGAEGEIHLFGDFAVFVAGYVHRKWHTVFIAERVDGCVDFTYCI